MTKQKAYKYRFVYLGIQQLVLAMAPSFYGGDYTKNVGGYYMARFICKYVPMPTVELVIGFFMIEYRQTVFFLQNQADTTGQADFSTKVGPFDEQGAKLSFNMLIIEMIVFVILTIFTLLVCKGSMKKEPQETSPEDDVYATPIEVKKEHERVQALVNSEGNGDDILLVHSLVKRYHTKKPGADAEEEPADRPAFTDEKVAEGLIPKAS